VRTNADQPDQCRTAIAFGAEGVGLTRTEHMFFEGSKIDAVREMILATDQEGRKKALRKLLPLQRKDFEGIFKAMEDRPVTIRTLDPPLHEFLPHEPKQMRALAKELGITAKALGAKIASLQEFNPMLGHRGCRLGITYPEITRMQARALFEAACKVAKSTGIMPRPEIMIPLISTAKELELQAAIVHEIAADVFTKERFSVPYLVGTMIELPRAALIAGEIAQTAEFFSFGTNDLTQTTYGISRDDGGSFVPEYIEKEIMPEDPFASLDGAGVGRLMEIACADGRRTRRGMKLGICGEHGGDPKSIQICQDLGLDYVSCSPYRVPIARLAAAQAAIARSL
jgi:pyruvate,orthophosphate dikinase